MPLQTRTDESRPQRARAFTVRNTVNDQTHNNRNNTHLQNNNQGAEVRHGLNAARRLEMVIKATKRNNKEPRRYGRYQRFEVNFASRMLIIGMNR